MKPCARYFLLLSILTLQEWLTKLESGVRLPQTELCPNHLYSRVSSICPQERFNRVLMTTGSAGVLEQGPRRQANIQRVEDTAEAGGVGGHLGRNNRESAVINY